MNEDHDYDDEDEGSFELPELASPIKKGGQTTIAWYDRFCVITPISDQLLSPYVRFSLYCATYVMSRLHWQG